MRHEGLLRAGGAVQYGVRWLGCAKMRYQAASAAVRHTPRHAAHVALRVGGDVSADAACAGVTAGRGGAPGATPVSRTSRRRCGAPAVRRQGFGRE